MLQRYSFVLFLLLIATNLGCRKGEPGPLSVQAKPPADASVEAPKPIVPWDARGPLSAGETYVLDGAQPRRVGVAEAETQGLLDLDLSTTWAPFIFSESDGGNGVVKPNRYRSTFVALANDDASPEELLMETPQGILAALSAAGISAGKGADESPEGKRAIAQARRVVRVQRDRNYLEAYGIPPTLAVLLARIEEDEGKACYTQWDQAGLAAFDGMVTYQSREQSRHDYSEALSDAAWVEKLLAGDRSAADATTGKVQSGLGDGMGKAAEDREALLTGIAKDDRKQAARIERYRRGQARLRAVRAVQARLICEGLLTPRTKYVHGLFDLATNEALAAWERKNDIFGWGFLAGETLVALQRPQMDLHFETFRRILTEHIADAAGILEDGSASLGKRNPTFKDGDGQEQAVPNLLQENTDNLLAALAIRTPGDMAMFLRRVGRAGLVALHLAFSPRPLPPYYGKPMELSVEIDRGDVWYDFPFDGAGKPVVQNRVNYPSLTVFVEWQKQKIPLVRWRTTIGSWRSEIHPNGKAYYRYKNSDVGPRIWRDIVAGPVWIPPEGTPAKDLLTKKVLDRDVGPVTVVNTDVMGPGFQSAYGLVLAIHHQKSGASLFDNQIRTHGSDDYTSIARRFSHGCHRLVNSRAVRMFDFILRRRAFERVGNMPLSVRKHFSYEDKQYAYQLDTRGYYYQLRPPIPVVVTEGRIMGKVKKPIGAYVRKPGVDYSEARGEVPSEARSDVPSEARSEVPSEPRSEVPSEGPSNDETDSSSPLSP